YTGTLKFTSSDSQALLPPNSTLTGGIGTFAAVLKTAGTQGITVTDTVNSALTGTANLTVNSASLARLNVSSPVSTDAGPAFSVTVTAVDAYNNVVTGYTGTVFFSGNDYQAIYPTASTLTNGTKTFTVTLETADSRNITVMDKINTGISGQAVVTVIPGPVTKLLVTAPSISPFAGSPVTMPLSARDAYDNFISTYNGIVHFTSSDPQAILPPDSALTNGIGTFTFTLKKALQQSVTATDVTNSSITGTAQFAVKPGPA